MDIKKLMKQAQTMQKKMQEMQKDVANKEFKGKSGGGLVSIILSGDGQMRKVDIDSSLMQKEEKEMLEDLVVAAYNEAKARADEESKNNMSGAFGNIGEMPSDLNHL